MGCSDKSASVQKLPETKQKTEVVKVLQVPEPKRTVVRNETLVEEPKVTKNIGADVPTSCAMWSDGSNICTRVSTRKASCTTNPVDQRMFSCLQWQ